MLDGYPQQRELEQISKWPYMDVFNLIFFIQQRWNWAPTAFKMYWTSAKFTKHPMLKVEMHTGGWSGNEDLINALLENQMVCMMWYKRWERGGHYLFEIVPFNIGYQPVIDFCKKHGTYKQYVHKYKENYDWLDIGNKKLLVRNKWQLNSSTSDERSVAENAK